MHALMILSLLGGVAMSAPEEKKEDRWWVFVGTYTGKDSKGIYLLEMDGATGKLTPKGMAGESDNPSFLALQPTGMYLYAVNEVGTFEGKKTGSVSAFAVDRSSGKLTLLNRQPSAGAGPCHIVVDSTGRNALVANYGGGSIASLPIGPDGKLAPPVSAIQHEGSSVNPQRQKEPHAHSINLDPSNRVACAADLGLDRIMLYRFDPDKGTLIPNEPRFAAVAPGSGPRHFAFHPSARFAYVINELANTVTAFAYDPFKGSLTEVQTVTTLPADFQGRSFTAEVVVHPSGKFLYGSNRGHNSIATFKIDPATGKLTATGHQTHEINTPRNFYVDPTGRYLLAASQTGNKVIVFGIDQESGELKPTGNEANIPTPVCVRMMRVP